MKKLDERNGKGRLFRLLLAAMAASLVLAAGLMSVSGVVEQYQITANSANAAYGTTTGSGIYTAGDEVTLTAIPASGYRFVNWLEGSPAAVACDSAVFMFPAEGDRTVTATFAAIGTPTLSSASSGGYESVKLVWTGVTGVAGYEIYKATSATGTYTKAATASGTSYTIKGLAAGKTYYFKVRAYAQAGAKVTYGKFSSVKYAKPLPGTPSLTAAPASYNSVKLGWKAIPGANGYAIYRATSSTGTYSLIYTAGATATSYTNKSLTTGKTYYYKIRAYHLEGTTKVYSAYSSVKSAKPVLASPATTSVIAKTKTSIKVSWTAVGGATKYQVYRASSATGTYSLVATVGSSTLSYTNTGLTYGSTYYYKVRAYHLSGTTKIYGGFGKVVSLRAGGCYTTGTYLVGRDIAPGEYLFVPTDASKGRISVCWDTLFEEDTWRYPLGTNAYITLNSGEYVRIEYAKAYPASFSTTPKVALDANGNLKTGMYKIGRDIPAGTYVLFPGRTSGEGYMETYKDSRYYDDSLLGYDEFRGRCPVTLTNGQYLYFEGGTGYTLAKAPPIVPVDGYLPEGMYKVGVSGDIKPGTYLVTPNSPEVASAAYFLSYSDDSHSEAAYLGGAEVPIETQVTLFEGEYILLYQCKIEMYQSGSDWYPADTYLIGRDMPADEYLVIPTDPDLGYMFTSSDATYDTSTFEAFLPFPQYITLTEGEYFTFEYARAWPVDGVNTPLVGLDGQGNLMAGMYKVGRDIPAGTYVLYPDKSSGDGYLETYIDSFYFEESLRGYDEFRGRCPVTLTDGMYLYFEGSVGYKLVDSPDVVPINGALPEGMYKVGEDGDLAAGTYVLSPTSPEDADFAYYYIYSDDSHSEASWKDGGFVEGDTQVTLQEGDHILLIYCTLKL